MKKHTYLLWILGLVMALGVAACGGNNADPAVETGSKPTESAVTTNLGAGDAQNGKALYSSNCATCHGPEANGITGLGSGLHDNEFIAGKSDPELIEFIKMGRSPGDPLNDTGVAMPPKGGNPALTDQNLNDIVAYLRTL